MWIVNRHDSEITQRYLMFYLNLQDLLTDDADFSFESKIRCLHPRGGRPRLGVNINIFGQADQ